MYKSFEDSSAYSAYDFFKTIKFLISCTMANQKKSGKICMRGNYASVVQ